MLALCWMALAAAPVGHAAEKWTLVGWNNLGMHCMDSDYSVFSILPPYNTVNAQVIYSTGTSSATMVTTLMTGADGVRVTYEAVADATGSINKTSVGKTNFWTHAQALFGVSLAADAGLAGFKMPGASNTPQAFAWDSPNDFFEATGIPIAPTDDQGRKNYYPMLRLKAYDATNTLRAQADVVVPVSDEMDCRNCHASNARRNDAKPFGGWVNDPSAERDFRLNILKKHDDTLLGTTLYQQALAAKSYRADGLYKTVAIAGKPILCAACHASEALPGSGYTGVSPLTQAMHSRHSVVVDPDNGLLLGAEANRTACYQCHPGSSTRCLRGAMGSAVAADGSMKMQCQSCHGNMRQVGSPTRTGWLDEPNCQQCHTGTAISNNGQIRYDSVYDASTGLPRVAVNQTFATNPNTPAVGKSLYRYSSGHGGMKCQACHGSTHAEYPAGPNDNVQSKSIQGHIGVLAECTACHAVAPPVSTAAQYTGGPHGLHPMSTTWGESSHKSSSRRTGCTNCHGSNWRGTVLSQMQASRSMKRKDVSPEYLTFWRGYQIGCYSCHNGTGGEGAPPASPVVTGTSLSVAAIPVSTTLGVTPATATVRIVTQPLHGTVAVSGKILTYYPELGYTGSDSFTVAARDSSNSVDSNLGTVSLNVASSYLLWAGDGAGNAWLGGSGTNWRLNATTPSAFNNGASVIFDDSGSASPSVSLNGTLSPASVTVSATKDYVFGGTGLLGGTMPLIKSGPGTLTLNDNNTYTGTTSISGGTVSAGVIAVTGGASSFGNATSAITLGDASSKGTLLYRGNTATFTRGFTVGAGGGEFDVTKAGQTLTISGNITAAGPFIIGGDGAATLSGMMSGAGSLIKTGTARLTISANQTFTGPMIVNEGSVKMSSNRTLAANKDVTIAGNAIWYLDGSSITVDELNGTGLIGATYVSSGTDTLTVGAANASSTFDGDIVGGSSANGLRRIALTKSGTGTFTLNGNNAYVGVTTINAGTLQIGNGGSSGTPGVGDIVNNATLMFNRGDLYYTTLAVSNLVSGTGDIVMAGSGRVFITGTANTYSGATRFAGGILNVASLSNYGVNSSLGNHSSTETASAMGLRFQGGTLQYTGATAQSTDRQICLSTIGGGGTLDASGSTPLATLSFTAPASLNLWENAGARTLTLTGGNTGDNTFATALGDYGGPTSFVKSGTGNWVLSGTHSHTGSTTVLSGTLGVSGFINSGPSATVQAINGGALKLRGGAITAGNVKIGAGSLLTGNGTITGKLVNEGTVLSDDSGPLIINGSVTNVGTMRFIGGASVQTTGLFVNNGVLDLITGASALPANFQNNGTVLDSSSVRVQGLATSGSDIQLSVVSVPGHNYQFQRSDSLTPALWQDVGAPLAGNGGPIVFTDPAGAGSKQRFYRVVVSP